MIRYALVCDNAHGFESWFRDGSAYDDQIGRGLIACPVCGSDKIGKAMMAPGLARRDRVGARIEPAAGSEPEPVALMSPEQVEMRTKIRELRAMLTQNSDYVGEKFADEARKMHFGEIDHRAIHGEANREEVRALLDDGVEVVPIPGLPEERN